MHFPLGVGTYPLSQLREVTTRGCVLDSRRPLRGATSGQARSEREPPTAQGQLASAGHRQDELHTPTGVGALHGCLHIDVRRAARYRRVVCCVVQAPFALVLAIFENCFPLPLNGDVPTNVVHGCAVLFELVRRRLLDRSERRRQRGIYREGSQRRSARIRLEYVGVEASLVIVQPYLLRSLPICCFRSADRSADGDQ